MPRDVWFPLTEGCLSKPEHSEQRCTRAVRSDLVRLADSIWGPIYVFRAKWTVVAGNTPRGAATESVSSHRTSSRPAVQCDADSRCFEFPR